MTSFFFSFVCFSSVLSKSVPVQPSPLVRRDLGKFPVVWLQLIFCKPQELMLLIISPFSIQPPSPPHVLCFIDVNRGAVPLSYFGTEAKPYVTGPRNSWSIGLPPPEVLSTINLGFVDETLCLYDRYLRASRCYLCAKCRALYSTHDLKLPDLFFLSRFKSFRVRIRETSSNIYCATVITGVEPKLAGFTDVLCFPRNFDNGLKWRLFMPNENNDRQQEPAFVEIPVMRYLTVCSDTYMSPARQGYGTIADIAASALAPWQA